MGKLWIAGLGPGDLGKITTETIRTIREADQVILRTEVHPAASGLSAMGIHFSSCDLFYDAGDSFPEIYQKIASYVMAEAARAENVCYCVPGHPLVAEDTVRLLLEQEKVQQKENRENRVEIQILPAVSFLDSAFVSLGIDPVQEQLTILDAASICDGDRSGLLQLHNGSCLFSQVYHLFVASELKLALLEEMAPDTEVWIVHHAGIACEEEILLYPLAELDHFKKFDHLTSVYVPRTTSERRSNRVMNPSINDKSLLSGKGDLAGESGVSRFPLDALVDTMQRLLAPDGCPWDKAQTHITLKQYLLEETNEVLEAIDENDMDHLKEELGDVLMQIVFHCALTENSGGFTVNDVIKGIVDKLVRRHPHIYGDEKADTPEEVLVLWNKVKMQEKMNKQDGK